MTLAGLVLSYDDDKRKLDHYLLLVPNWLGCDGYVDVHNTDQVVETVNKEP